MILSATWKSPVLAGALALLCSTALAETASPIDDASSYFADKFGRGGYNPEGSGLFRENFLVMAMSDFRRLSGEDQVLDPSDIEAARSIQSAGYRSMIVQKIMAHDINGDAAVTADEIRQSLSVSPERRMPGGVDGLLKGYLVADADGDKTITMAEASAFAKQRPMNPRPGGRDSIQSMEDMLALAPAGIERLTANDMDASARAAFAAMDGNGDGQLSGDELAPIQQRMLAARESGGLPRSVCKLPRISANARFIYIGGYEAGALSSATVAGQDTETETQEIAVAPGKGPVFIVATSYTPMIWRLTGAVDRVEAFIATGRINDEGKIASGVTGIPASKASFQRAECVPARPEPSEGNTAKLRTTLKALTGRTPDELITRYTLSSLRGVTGPAGAESVSLPASTAKPYAAYPKTVSRETYQEMLRFSPGGSFDIDPKSVVSDAKVEAFEVLPQQAGLLQLEAEGAIKRETGQGRGQYRIVKKMARFPAGLNGAHSVQFTLAPGVALPEGSPGHSTVVSEESGEVLSDPFMREQRRFVDPFEQIGVPEFFGNPRF